LYNFTLPDWTDEVLPKFEQRLHDIAAFSFKMISFTDELKRLKGGPLLKELIQNFKNKSENSMDERRKFFMYSAHDTVRTVQAQHNYFFISLLTNFHSS
jgi:lysosomal acid phosphatase